MKLKRRRKEKQSRAAITYPTIIPPGRGQSPAPVPLSSLHHSILSSSTRPTSPHPAAPSLPAATDRETIAPAISLPAVSPSPFLLHKLPKQQSVAAVTWRSTQLAGPVVDGAQLAAGLYPPGSSLILLPSPVSRRGPSAAIGTIGKQRPKMNYSVSSSSLMNK